MSEYRHNMNRYLDPDYKKKWHARNRGRISARKIAKYAHKIGSMQQRIDLFISVLGKLTEGDIGYIAGLVDGEGSISMGIVGSRHPNRDAHLHCEVVVSNTDRGMIEWIHGKFRGRINWEKGIGINGSPAKLIARWRLSGKIAALLCEKIYPYLTTIKKQRAMLVIELFNKSNHGTPGFILSAEEIERRKVILASFKSIK